MTPFPSFAGLHRYNLVSMDAIEAGVPSDVPDTARHRALSAASRVRMLDVVRRADGGVTAAQVVEATGLHPSTVRAHLDQLARSGLLARQRRSDGSPGRPAWRYQAVARPEEHDHGAETSVRIASKPGRLVTDERVILRPRQSKGSMSDRLARCVGIAQVKCPSSFRTVRQASG